MQHRSRRKLTEAGNIKTVSPTGRKSEESRDKFL